LTTYFFARRAKIIFFEERRSIFCLNREEGSIKAKYLHTVVGLDKSTDDHRKNQDPPQNAFEQDHHFKYFFMSFSAENLF
jgi:hypothetical protein